MKQPIALKKLAMRVNQQTPLGAFTPKMSERNAPQYVRGGALLMPKNPEAAQPITNDLWQRPVLEMARWESARPEADQHLSHKSRGF